MDWYNNYRPKIAVQSYNSYGEVTVTIWDDSINNYKKYQYYDVSPIDIQRLESYIKHKNNSAAFKLIKQFKQIKDIKKPQQ